MIAEDIEYFRANPISTQVDPDSGLTYVYDQDGNILNAYKDTSGQPTSIMGADRATQEQFLKYVTDWYRYNPTTNLGGGGIRGAVPDWMKQYGGVPGAYTMDGPPEHAIPALIEALKQGVPKTTSQYAEGQPGSYSYYDKLGNDWNNVWAEAAQRQAEQRANKGFRLSALGDLLTGGLLSATKGDYDPMLKFQASIGTGTASNIYNATRENSVGEGLTTAGDITGGLFTPTVVESGANTGAVFGEGTRQVIGNYVMPAAGALFGGPFGAMGATILGSRFAGNDADTAWQRGAVAGGTAHAAGVAGNLSAGAASAAGGGATGAVAGGATQAATDAAINAGTQYLTTGEVDPLQMAAAGVGGGIDFATPGLVQAGGQWLDIGKPGYAITGGLLGAGRSAATQAIANRGDIDPYGVGMGALTGAYKGWQQADKPQDSEYVRQEGWDEARPFIRMAVDNIGQTFAANNGLMTPQRYNAVTAPAWTMLNTKRGDNSTSPTQQDSELFAWKRMAAPLAPAYDGYQIVDTMYQPTEDTSTMPDIMPQEPKRTVKTVKGDYKAPEQKKAEDVLSKVQQKAESFLPNLGWRLFA